MKLKFERMIKVYTHNNVWIGEIISNDVNVITGKPRVWCFRTAGGDLLAQEELIGIAGKLAELNAEECPVKDSVARQLIDI